MQLLHILSQKTSRNKKFAVSILVRVDSNPRFLKRVLFSDDLAFHFSGMKNRHNFRLWGSENPQESPGLERDYQ